MKKNIITYILIIGVAVLTVYLLAVFISNNRITEYTEVLEIQTTEQEAALSEIATVSARNGAVPEVDGILLDCSAEERERFDTLLGSLDSGLDQATLDELDSLFGRCGDYFAERKAVQTLRLEQELERYESTVELLSTLNPNSNHIEKLDAWRELVRLEQTQSQLFTQLVAAQDRIIQTLRSNDSMNAESVVEASQAAREVQENLLLASTQAGALREELGLE